MKLGLIGLGAIGLPVARRIAPALGADLLVADLRDEPLAELAGLGATVVSDWRDLADADMVAVAVVTDEEVGDLLRGPDGVLANLAPGVILVIHSTITVALVRELAVEAEQAGIHLLDVPVSTMVDGADEGTLYLIAGGATDVLDRARPLLDLYANHLEHVGPVGAGMAVKLARNVVVYGAMAAAFEGLALAEAAGVEPRSFRRICRDSDAFGLTPLVLGRRTAAPFTVDQEALAAAAAGFGIEEKAFLDMTRDGIRLGVKDLREALDLAAELQIDLPLTEVTRARYPLVLGVDD